MSLARFTLVSVSVAMVNAWYIRGTQNAWGASELRPSGTRGLPWMCQMEVFEGGDAHGGSRFRVTREADSWEEAYPVQGDQSPPRNVGVFHVCFNEETKEIDMVDHGNPRWWYVRGGGSTGQGSKRMEQQEGEPSLWCAEEEFEVPLLRVSKFARSWEVAAYPEAEYYRINDGVPGRYLVCFDEATHSMTLKKLDVVAHFICDNGHTEWGQGVFVVGSVAELGSWIVEVAVPLNTTEETYPKWEGKVRLPVFTNVEWKCLKRNQNDNGRLFWQGSSNAFNTGGTNYIAHSSF